MNQKSPDRLLEEIKKTLRDQSKKKFESVEGWRNFFYSGQYEQPQSWIYGKEVRVFKTADVTEQVVPHVIAGIEDLIRQIGLNFEVNYYGSHPSAIEEVNQSLTENGLIDNSKLSKILANEIWRKPEYGGKPHADAIIVGRYFIDANGDWGRADYRDGSLILALPETRQKSIEFIIKIAKHETGHLLGFMTHHDRFAGKVNGYSQVPNCNMQKHAPTINTCDLCADAIKYLWLGFQNRTSYRFFK